MCKGNGELSLRTVWQNLVLGINRRGYSSSGKVEDGCVMGWTGCTDTILHATIVSYVVHKAKMRGILHTKESAYSYELIDDSVLDLQLDALADLAADRVSRFLELMVEHYASLGLEIDRVKTIMSTVKMTFLNRVFSCGAEVLTPAKVAAKVDREITRRFSSILEQIAALFTSASSASARGADSFAHYICCTQSLGPSYGSLRLQQIRPVYCGPICSCTPVPVRMGDPINTTFLDA